MITLEKYSASENKSSFYVFDPKTGAYWLKSKDTTTESTRECSGFADERTVGWFKKRIIFVAIYLYEDALHVFVDNKTFQVNNDLQFRRRGLFPYVKTFEIINKMATVLNLKYIFLDNYDFPGPLAYDIFLYIAKSLSSEISRERTIYWLRAQAAGRNTFNQEFLDEVEQHLGKTFNNYQKSTLRGFK